MDLKKFNKLMDTHGVAYITYTSDYVADKKTAPKNTFVVGTLEFDDKHIARVEAENIKVHGSPRPEVGEGEVLIFSYSKDKFRTLKLDSIKFVTSLSAEMKKAS